MVYYQEPGNPYPYGYDETDPSQVPLIDAAILAGWTDVTGSWPPAETLEQTVINCLSAVQEALNSGAVDWGYLSLLDGISYSISGDTQNAADAITLSDWRDSVNAWLVTAVPDIVAGEATATFLADMPPQPARP